MIDEEISVIKNEINDKFSDNEKLLKEIDDKHSSDIKILNEKVIATNKRCDESVAALKVGADTLKELASKIDNHSGETNRKLQQLQSEVRTKMALINASPVTRSVVNEQMREVKFKGSSDFPIEFIKKLTELYHEHYHDINDIAWVSRHLELSLIHIYVYKRQLYLLQIPPHSVSF